MSPYDSSSLPSHKPLGRTEADFPGRGRDQGGVKLLQVLTALSVHPVVWLELVYVVVELSSLEMRLMEITEILSAQSFP